MRIVDIELYRSEEVLNSVVLDIATIDEVLVLATNDNLSSDSDLIIMFISQWRLFLVSVVKCDGDSCLGHTSLTILVHQLLEVGCSHMAQIGDSKQKADSIKNVTFTRPTQRQNYTIVNNKLIITKLYFVDLPIESSDSIKLMIKSFDFSPLSIGLETIYNHFFHKHLGLF